MKILLVDDEERSRLNLADFLGKLGHQVLQSGSAVDALQILENSSADLLLTDNRMPGMSGLDLMRKAADLPNYQDLAMVMFTAYGDMDSSILALRAGAFDYLLKPLNIEELVKTLQRVEHRIGTNGTISPVTLIASSEEGELDTATESPQDYSQQYGCCGEMMVYSRALRKVMALARKLHLSRNIPVLIEGETGTGKELVARYIHYGDENLDAPFVALNCAAIPDTLFESELMGYEGGSFSGSHIRGSKGKVDLAQGGTLFLDEISEIPLNIQAKLLRLIQEKEFYRVGGLNLIKSDVRIIGASNQNLKTAVERGSFRQDLYYRLKVGSIYLPPLRERQEIILPVANKFLQKFSGQNNKSFQGFTPEAARILINYRWPGNIRELRNLIEWIVVSEDVQVVDSQHLTIITNNDYWWQDKNPIQEQEASFDSIPEGMPLNEISNVIIQKALAKNGGNKAATARYLGISRSALYKRLAHFE
ncbi:MAG: sigma-54-dependent Fis family transcriptional regulator [Syntrophomonadaceae bacterium]|nr:sigma-54-dependent Fis family transcriptional regulator [Syntrophomonadaceae bacterium]